MLCRRHCVALDAGPLGFVDLPSAANGESVFGNIVGDARRCANVRAFAEFHRGHESGIAADEDAILDHRLVLVNAVVVAGDGAGADVHFLADYGITKIGEVIGFGAAAKLRLLQLDEVADVGSGGDFIAGTKMREGTETNFLVNAGVLENAVGLDNGASADLAVDDDGAGLDATVGADTRATEDLYERIDDGVGLDW